MPFAGTLPLPSGTWSCTGTVLLGGWPPHDPAGGAVPFGPMQMYVLCVTRKVIEWSDVWNWSPWLSWNAAPCGMSVANAKVALAGVGGSVAEPVGVAAKLLVPVALMTAVRMWSPCRAALASVLPWMTAFLVIGVPATVIVIFADGASAKNSSSPMTATAPPAKYSGRRRSRQRDGGRVPPPGSGRRGSMPEGGCPWVVGVKVAGGRGGASRNAVAAAAAPPNAAAGREVFGHGRIAAPSPIA